MPSKSDKRYERLQKLAYFAIVIALAALVVSIAGFSNHSTVYVNKTIYLNGTTKNATLPTYNINSTLITPLYYLPSSPPISDNKTPGDTLNGINTQLNQTDLAILNNAPNSYFETAGLMYLNGSITNEITATANKVPVFTVNGKPSVIYFGSITCVFCGENRWAMALALSRFGNFSQLFTGYSAIGDSDVPTIYWAPAVYNGSAVDLGSFYKSNYINFIAIEDTEPISGGFALQLPILVAQQREINATGNLAYMSAMQYIRDINNFQGTPYSIWGSQQVGGANAVDFGDNNNAAPLPLANWTHAQVFERLAKPTSSFAWTEYAAADVYAAMTCASINNSAPFCALPVIPQIEQREGYS